MTANAGFWQAIDKEENLRLTWYVRNEETIRKCAEKISQGVTEDQNNDLIDIKTHMVDNRERKFRLKGRDEALGDMEEHHESANEEYVSKPGGIMKPVLADINAMIYTKGRIPYLKARNNLLPENRYYLKETTGFEYGWQMWDCAKTMEMVRHGKSAIIKQTFYRRRAGIERDPHWYRTPIRLSPTVCNKLN